MRMIKGVANPYLFTLCVRNPMGVIEYSENKVVYTKNPEEIVGFLTDSVFFDIKITKRWDLKYKQGQFMYCGETRAIFVGKNIVGHERDIYLSDGNTPQERYKNQVLLGKVAFYPIHASDYAAKVKKRMKAKKGCKKRDVSSAPAINKWRYIVGENWEDTEYEKPWADLHFLSDLSKHFPGNSVHDLSKVIRDLMQDTIRAPEYEWYIKINLRNGEELYKKLRIVKLNPGWDK